MINSYADTILLRSMFMFAFTVMHVSAVNRHDLDEADDDWMELCDFRDIGERCYHVKLQHGAQR